MNVMQQGIVPAVVVGVIVAISNMAVNRWATRSDAADATLIELRSEVGNLSRRFDEFAKQPFVRREEYLGVLGGIENRLAGIEQRISNVERTALERRQRER